ncbi:uncharacterized protein LAJ45_03512 [Morchella importuna]|uniref:uncharacterized protein n=1 Tax=Morchella importuna TaxID=1174673 RepID=UPI001E8E9020|nr:uncharacterized protein LAJ45_03512 [Morchella importuna]KAH8152671.1 hypothetical protein LAJ45_03512 [Morchella importuna]
MDGVKMTTIARYHRYTLFDHKHNDNIRLDLQRCTFKDVRIKRNLNGVQMNPRGKLGKQPHTHFPLPGTTEAVPTTNDNRP